MHIITKTKEIMSGGGLLGSSEVLEAMAFANPDSNGSALVAALYTACWNAGVELAATNASPVLGVSCVNSIDRNTATPTVAPI